MGIAFNTDHHSEAESPYDFPGYTPCPLRGVNQYSLVSYVPHTATRNTQHASCLLAFFRPLSEVEGLRLRVFACFFLQPATRTSQHASPITNYLLPSCPSPLTPHAFFLRVLCGEWISNTRLLSGAICN
jgi:hypothetical protein